MLLLTIKLRSYYSQLLRELFSFQLHYRAAVLHQGEIGQSITLLLLEINFFSENASTKKYRIVRTVIKQYYY